MRRELRDCAAQQKGSLVSKVLVLYYSAYGHIETMANAVAEGARQAGARVDIKRVPELVSEEIAAKAHYKLDQTAPIAISLATTRSSSAPAPGSAGYRRKWRISSINPAASGRAAHYTARSAARSPRPVRNTVVRR
jgi:hypothetical protein